MLARFTHSHSSFKGLKYFKTEQQPVLATIWEFEVLQGLSTQPGDSGCAVLNEEGSVCVRMHLGGMDGTRRIFVLPAYLLLQGINYELPCDLELSRQP